MATIAFACEDIEVRPMWVLVLEQAGHHVKEIDDYSKVKRVLQSERFDLVVLNMRANPDKAAAECIILKDLYPDQRVAYMSDQRSSRRAEVADAVITRDTPRKMLESIQGLLATASAAR